MVRTPSPTRSSGSTKPVHEDPALKMIRVGDALVRGGRGREATAVYRRAAHLFEEQHRIQHARAAWRLVLKTSPLDAEACERIVEMGGLPTAPESRAGFSTRIVELDREEIERTMLADEMVEITDAGGDLAAPALLEQTFFESTVPMAPIGYVGASDPEITVPSAEPTEPGWRPGARAASRRR